VFHPNGGDETNLRRNETNFIGREDIRKRAVGYALTNKTGRKGPMTGDRYA
jgi:hypothetical protein